MRFEPSIGRCDDDPAADRVLDRGARGRRAVLALCSCATSCCPSWPGFALAYLLDPLADRLQRLGLGRLGATLIILVLFVLVFIVALVLLLPLRRAPARRLRRAAARLCRAAAGSSSIRAGRAPDRAARRRRTRSPTCSARSATSSGRASAWFGALPARRSWSGGQALLSVFALLVVTPVVAFYLLVDWDRMVATVDSWLPLRQRDTIRAIARDIDHAIAGFVRGQAIVCLHPRHLLRASGSHADRPQFRRADRHDGRASELHPLCRLAHRPAALGRRRHRAVLAGLDLDPRDSGGLRRRPVRRGQHPVAEARRRLGRPSSGLADVRAPRLRLAVRLRRAAARGAARRRVGVLARYALRRYMASPLYHGGAGRLASRGPSITIAVDSAAPEAARLRPAARPALRARGFSRQPLERAGLCA